MSPLAALLLVIPIFASAPEAVVADTPTAYQILKRYGFPVGLLPKGVTSYELDADTGKFVVNLNESCTFTVSGYDLKYRTKITGKISTEKITNLDGIQVKVLFFWVNIIQVTIDRNDLEFSVGIASANFPVDNFDDSPQCGCGFDCGNESQRTGGFRFERLLPPLIDV